MADGTIRGCLDDPNFGVFTQNPASVSGLLGVVDAYPEEYHNYEVSTTNYPIETGGTLTDNAYVEPRILTMRAYVSEFLPSADTIVKVNGRSRAIEAWERIREVASRREPVTVVTLIETYPNMLITAMNPVVNESTGYSLVFDISFKEVIFANTQITQLPPARVSGPAADRTSTVEGGQKQSREVEEDSAQGSSLRGIANFVSGN